MTDEKIIEYVMNSPENTNPSVLGSMLKSKGTEIKTVVIKGVIDKTKGVKDLTTGDMVYTPNMTYEEVRDMLLNLEPFNVIWIEGYPIYGLAVVLVKYDRKNNRIEFTVTNGSSSAIFYWTAAGILPMPK